MSAQASRRAIPRALLSALAFATGSTGALFSQTTSPSVPPATAADPGETIILSPFTVSSEGTSRYQATEATSGTRVRVSLIDSTQSVSVVTRDLIEDIGAARVIDAAKYVSGVYESTIPNAQDRTTVRGFQSDGATVDGFNYFSFANLDPVIVERIEVVKGPNAIIAPQGVPGGTINNVSKKPVFQNRGYVSAQGGLYSSTRGELDVNRVLRAGKLAVRISAAAQDADDYGDGNYHSSAIAMPQFTYRFSPKTEITVQAQISNWWALNFGGVPVSVYSGSNDKARLTDGIDREFIAQREDISRHQSAQHYRAFFTTSFTDNLSLRIAGNWINSHGSSSQMNIGAINAQQVQTRDPATGLSYWNGTRNDNPQFTFGGSLNTQDRTYANLQNDLVYEFKTDALKSTTVAGYALNYTVVENEKNRNFLNPTTGLGTLATQSLRGYVYPAYVLAPTLNGWNTRHFRDHQIYLYESLALFNERLLLSAGLSKNWYYTDNYDHLTNGRAKQEPEATLPSGGIVFKLLKNVSVYYGYSEQSTAINPSVTATNLFDAQTSRQHEFGVRTQQFDNRLYVSLAYFDIKQDNFSIPNPANSAVPVPNPLLPPLFFDRVADGVELEFNYAVTKNLSFVGNGTVMKNRNSFDVPFRGTAEKSAALWTNYVFEKSGPLSGFSVGVGADYLSKRAGDSPSGFTTPTSGVPVQPSFWLEARTLVNANLTYRIDEHWKTQLNVDNLFDKEYLQSSTGRTNVWPGMPLNAKLTVTYSF
jgi:iron complex outermembrane receptor protein